MRTALNARLSRLERRFPGKADAVESLETQAFRLALRTVSDDDLELLRIEVENRERGVYEMAPEVEAALERFWVALCIEHQKLGIEHEDNFGEYLSSRRPDPGGGR
jgi:hypothetical protein